MPLYEYACRKCDTAFERRLSFSQREEAQPCPACGAEESEPLLSVPARPGAGAQPAAPVCPSTGQACGCPAPQMN